MFLSRGDRDLGVKKETENFIRDNLRILTQEKVFQKALRTVVNR